MDRGPPAYGGSAGTNRRAFSRAATKGGQLQVFRSLSAEDATMPLRFAP